MTPEVIKSGGYTPKNVKESGKHGDARLKKYRDDQLRGREARERRLELSIDAFINRKRREWDALLAPVHDAMAFVKDGAGHDLSVAEVDARRVELVATRGRYKRKDGAWAALRSQRVVVGPDGKALRNEKNRKRPLLERVPIEETKVILHEAFELDPRLSLALTHAAKAAPQGGAWREFLEATAADVADLVEQHIGARPELVPYHPKALAGHFQPEFCIVDAAGNKLTVRQRVHLGPAMVGAARWRGMGFKGADLDALTGIKDSEVGLDYVLKSRGEKACDWLVLRDLDAITSARLKEPRYSSLLPFWEQGCRDYEDYLSERRHVIGAEAAAKRLKAELDASEERAERAEGDWKRTDALATKNQEELKRSMGLLKKAGARMKALEAENAALKGSPVFVVHNGQRWTPHQLKDALERLASGQERGTDEFVLDDSGCVAVSIMRQLESFERHPDLEVGTDALVALRAAKARNERWFELGKREAREDVRKNEKQRPPEDGDAWKHGEGR